MGDQDVQLRFPHGGEERGEIEAGSVSLDVEIVTLLGLSVLRP